MSAIVVGRGQRGEDWVELRVFRASAGDDRVQRAVSTAVAEALARRDEQDQQRAKEAQRRAQEEQKRAEEQRTVEVTTTQLELLELIESCSPRELQRLLRDPEFEEAVESILNAR